VQRVLRTKIGDQNKEASTHRTKRFLGKDLESKKELPVPALKRIFIYHPLKGGGIATHVTNKVIAGEKHFRAPERRSDEKREIIVQQ